jgi:hypothetical protein
MLDNALINLIATSLEAASAAFGWNYIVVQKDEPTQQGIPTDPTIFFEKLFDTSRHFPMEKYSVNAFDATKLDDTEVQLVETVFQVSALVIQDPNNLSLPTASDVANALRGFLISRNNADGWRAQGVGTLPPSQVRNPYIQDDRNRNEAFPSFDISLTHSRANVAVIGTFTNVTGDPIGV